MIDPLAQLEELMDAAWERQLALFLGDLAEDLLAGQITPWEAHLRLEAIKERSEDK